MMHRNRHKKGISTVIAALFMVATIIVGIIVLSWTSNLQNNFGQVMTETNVSGAERVGEKAAVQDVRIDSNKLNMTVVNAGSLPVKLVKIWVTNTTDVNGWHREYTLNRLINPGDSLTNIGQELSLVATNSSSYKINIVTERGSSTNFQLLSTKDKAVKMSLFATPRSIPTGQNVTIMFGVTNNLTDGNILQSVSPKLPLNWTGAEASSGSTTVSATLIEGPTPTVEKSLTLGETVFFKWIYKVTGDKGDKINFNATIVNAKQGNYITESADVVIDSFAEQSNISLQSLGISGVTTNYSFKKGSFAKCTTTNCDNVITGVGFQPKAVIFFWTRQTTEGLGSGIHTGIGFASSPTNERAIAVASDDNVGTSNTGKYQSNTRSIVMLSNGAPTLSAQGDLTSFDADGFTIDWPTSNENSADIIHYIALGGSSLTNALASTFSAPTAVGNYDVTTVGFQPDYVMLISIDATGSGGFAPAEYHMGFASGPTARGTVAVNFEDGQGTSDTWVRQRADRFIHEFTDSGGEDMRADFVSFLSNGFRINNEVASDNTDIHYLALKGGEYKVGSFNKSTAAAPASQSVTGGCLKPNGLILASKNLVSNTAIEPEGRISFGASDGTTEGAIWFHDKDAFGDSDTNQRTDTTKIAVHGSQSTLNAAADLTSFNADGFTLNWTTNNAVSEEVLYAIFGNSVLVTGQDVAVTFKNTGTDTIWINENSRVIFNNTSTGAVYGGLIKSWKNETSAATGNINSTANSDGIEPGKELKFYFSEPMTIPGKPGAGTSVNNDPGQYNVYVRLSGYDEKAQFVLRRMEVGCVVV